MKNINFKMKEKGVSLMELIIYIGIMAIILGSITSFIYTNNKLKNRNQAINEVDQGATEVMQIIAQSLRNAAAVNSPAAGVSASALSINTDTTGNNPTVFDLSGTYLRIKEGSASEINLNNEKIEISNLSFKNLGASGSMAIIAIEFTASYHNPGGREEINYSKIFYDSASLR